MRFFEGYPKNDGGFINDYLGFTKQVLSLAYTMLPRTRKILLKVNNKPFAYVNHKPDYTDSALYLSVLPITLPVALVLDLATLPATVLYRRKEQPTIKP